MSKTSPTRRRGEDLLTGVYEVVLQLLEVAKPTSLTFQQVAQAAGTSRTVLYRRWPTMFALLQDAYTHKAQQLFAGAFFDQLTDTGSLQGDLTQLLTVYQQVYEEVGVELLNSYYYLRYQDKDDAQEPAVHTQALTRHLDAVRALLDRARQRAEPLREVATITLMLPFDLVRIENLLRPGNLAAGRLAELVEQVLLPVFSSRPAA